jgi:phage pi2 protein 07
MYEDIERKIQYIEYSTKALSDMMLEVFVSPYVEDGGEDFSIVGINYQKEIIVFETKSNLASLAKIEALTNIFGETNTEYAKILIANVNLVFYSGNSGKDWVVGVGDNIKFIEKFIEDIWHSLFEL